MRKFGKFEHMRKKAILQTYFTSLLSLILCVTMFFGTSLAWFTDTAQSTQNEVYVGTLEVVLKHATFRGGKQQKPNAEMTDVTTENYKILKSGKGNENGIRWEPGYTAVEKFELTEKGDLAFSYHLGIECKFENTMDGENIAVSKEAKEAIAKEITVWSYDGTNAESITELSAENFETLTKADWTKVGTLYDVITQKLPVFEGEMNKDTVNAEDAKAYHMIALHMDESFDGFVKDANGNATASSVQGNTLNDITIKLVATQKHSEQDAFGTDYDEFVKVATLEQLEAALENAVSGTTILFTEDIEGDVTVTQKKDVSLTIDGNGKKFTGIMTVFGGGEQDGAESLKIRNIKFNAKNGAGSCIVSPDRAVNNAHSYAHNITIEKCTFTDPDGGFNCAAIRTEDGGDKNWIIKDCIVDNTMHSMLQVANIAGKLTIDNCTVSSQNGINLNSTTNLEMTNSKFNVKGYAVRFGVSTGGNLGTPKTYVLKDNNLASECKDGDALIMFRASAVDAKLTLTNNILSATKEISGNTTDTTIVKN